MKFAPIFVLTVLMSSTAFVLATPRQEAAHSKRASNILASNLGGLVDATISVTWADGSPVTTAVAVDENGTVVGRSDNKGNLEFVGFVGENIRVIDSSYKHVEAVVELEADHQDLFEGGRVDPTFFDGFFPPSTNNVAWVIDGTY